MISDKPPFFGWLNIRYVNWVNRVVEMQIRPMRFIAGPDDRHIDAKILMEVEVLVHRGGAWWGEVWQIDPSKILDWNVPQPVPKTSPVPPEVAEVLSDWDDK